MTRPELKRYVRFMPKVDYFKPAGIPVRELEEIDLKVEELESLRLKEIDGMDQESASVKMGVSRITFRRILKSAHRKVSEALIFGKALKIKGGNYLLKSKNVRRKNG
jgi:predicted DNA-binding protein (UPF0251 family)